MAKSLTDTIGGQQTQIDTQEAQARAGAAGTMTPLGNATLGLNPDQAKMAGTPAQKYTTLTQALQTDIQEDMDIRTAERRQDYERKQEGFEAKTLDPAFGGIANLSDTVQAKTDAAIQSALASTTASPNEQNIEKALDERTTLNPAAGTFKNSWELGKLVRQQQTAIRNKQWGLVNELAGKIAPLRAEQEELERQNREIGRTQMNDAYTKLSNGDSLSPEELRNLSWIIGKDVGAGELATQQEIQEFLMVNPEEIEIANNLTAADLDDPELMGQIATTLGKDPTEIAGMSVRELQDAIDGVQAAEFDTGAELQRMATDPAAGPAERAMAAQAMEDFGAVMGEQAELEFEELTKMAEEMTTIEFGGKEYDMDELLNSEEMSAVIKDYFSNPEIADQLRKEEPEFAALLDKHSTVLEQMTKGIEATYEKVDTLVEEQKQALMSEDGQEIPTDVITSILGREVDPNKIGENFVDELQESALYQAYKDPAAFAKENGLTQQEAATLKSVLPDISEMDPQFMRDIAKMTATEIAALVRPDESGAAPIENAQRYQAEQDMLLKRDAKNDPESFYDVLAGPGQGNASGRLQDLVATAMAATSLGTQLDPSTKQLVDLLDADKDGQLDDAAAIQQRLKDKTGGKSFSELLSVGASSLVMDTAAVSSKLLEGQNPMFIDALKDGEIGTADLNRMHSASLEDMQYMRDNLGQFVSEDASKRLDQIITGKTNQQIREATNLDVPAMEREFAEFTRQAEEGMVPSNRDAYYKQMEHLAQIAESPAFASYPKSVKDIVNKHKYLLNVYQNSPSRAFLKSQGRFNDIDFLGGSSG